MLGLHIQISLPYFLCGRMQFCNEAFFSDFRRNNYWRFYRNKIHASYSKLARESFYILKDGYIVHRQDDKPRLLAFVIVI